MSRARTSFLSGVFVLIAGSWPAATLACDPPAPWLQALDGVWRLVFQ